MKPQSSLIAVFSLAVICFCCAHAKIVDTCQANGMLALTFDEGPSQYMEELLQILAKNKIKASFHIIAKYLTTNSFAKIVKAAYAQGHDVGLRLDPALDNNMRPDVVVKSLMQNAKFIEKNLGFRPKFVRLPYGETSSSLTQSIEQAGFIVTRANLDSQDYTPGTSIDDIVEKYDLYLGNAPDGMSSFISVQRDQVHNSVLAVPQIIGIARENGYKIVRLSDCLGVSGDNGGARGGDDGEVPVDSGKHKGKGDKSNKSHRKIKNSKNPNKKHKVGAMGTDNGAGAAFSVKVASCVLIAVGSIAVLF